MNLAGYIRVSTEQQVDAFGKDVQIEAEERWAMLNGHTIGEWFEEDAVSGKTDGGDRPVLASIVARADEFDGVVAFDATRLARRLVVQETLLGYLWNAGLKVYTTTAGELDADEDDPTRIMIRQILGVMAEFEHRTIVRRLKAGRLAKSAQGGYIGGTPKYGLSVVGTGKAAQFVRDEVESSVIEVIKGMRDSGLSLQAIADGLNTQHIPTKRDKAWLAPQVQRILQRYESESTKAVREATC